MHHITYRLTILDSRALSYAGTT